MARAPVGWRRTGQVQRSLLIALACLFVVVGGFWTWRFFSAPQVADAGAAAVREVIVKCNACSVQTQMPADKLAALERNEAGTQKCPSCGKFALQSPYRKGGTMRPAGGG